MPKEEIPIENTTGENTGVAPSLPVQVPDPQVSTQNQNTPLVSPQASNDLLSKKDALELVEKARREEKGKVYSEIEKLKAEKAKTEAKNSELEQKAESRQEELENIRAGKIEEKESVNRELRELREENKKMGLTVEAVVDSAAERVRTSELTSFKEKKIREAGLTQLADFVSGDDEASIEASIKVAKDKETKMLEAAREQVRAQLVKDLPQPISIDGSQGRDSTSVVSPLDREKLARLPKDEYKKVRDQLFQEARKKLGYT